MITILSVKIETQLIKSYGAGFDVFLLTHFRRFHRFLRKKLLKLTELFLVKAGFEALFVSNPVRIARKWSGVVPQQPPMIVAPQSRGRVAYYVIGSGVPS